jgi:hypothetical protein
MPETAEGGSSEIPNLAASFLTISSESFVPSPDSNIDMAGCLHPISKASDDCEIFASRRAWAIFLHISGEMFFKTMKLL